MIIVTGGVHKFKHLLRHFEPLGGSAVLRLPDQLLDSVVIKSLIFVNFFHIYSAYYPRTLYLLKKWGRYRSSFAPLNTLAKYLKKLRRDVIARLRASPPLNEQLQNFGLST